MLTPELDLLRDKTLSFGCVIWNDAKSEERYDGSQGKNHIYKIIGHPLDRGRLCHLKETLYPDYTSENYDKFYICFDDIDTFISIIGFDRTELDWIYHEARPKLKKLLIQFSNLCNYDGNINE